MSDYLPEEIVNRILLGLPVKSLVKCTAVCKSWNSLVRSSAFITTHLQLNHENDNAPLLLLNSAARTTKSVNGVVRTTISRFRFFCLHWDNSEFGEYSNLMPPPISNGSKYVGYVIGTCNGLVCLHNSAISPIILWNPSIRKYVCSPSRSPATTESVGENFAFGYDSVSNDYKVLRLRLKGFSGVRERVCEAEVWSFLRGDWKSLTCESSERLKLLYHSFECGYAFVNSALHWGQYDYFRGTVSIVAFDLVNESFHQVVMPPDLMLREETIDDIHVSRYGDSIAWFEFQSYEEGDTFDLWVMKEYGVAESWTKLCTISLSMLEILRPFGFRKSGELVLQVEHEGAPDILKLVDLKSKQIKDFGTDGYKYNFVDSFTESLALFDQANVISY